MPISRYDDRKIFENDVEMYQSFCEQRGKKSIVHYATPELTYPTVEQTASLQLIGHVWQLGDKLYKLADSYYSDPTLWWVIAWFNQRPTESHIKINDVISIPLPLDKILRYLRI